MFNKDFIVSNKLILRLGTCTYQFRTDFIRLYSKFQNRRSNDNGRPSHLHVGISPIHIRSVSFAKCQMRRQVSRIGKPDFNKLFLDAFPIMMNDNNGPYNYISIFFLPVIKKMLLYIIFVNIMLPIF